MISPESYETYLHVNREGIKQSVSEMTDYHLINTIRLWCQKISEIFQELEGRKEKSGSINELIDRLQAINQQVVWYVLEASLRGLPVSQYLRFAYGRSKAELPRHKEDNQPGFGCHL